jgi:uracil-DNA glycosylase family protein
MTRRPKGSAASTSITEVHPKTLDDLNRLILAASPLVPGATRVVFGEGAKHAPIAFVGEQPGDQEDIEGRPFVGPAGKLLTRAMAEAGIDRKVTYVTNVVKNFKFEQRGKRRIHQRPTAGEVKRYRWWLEKELDLVRPRIVVALGAIAVLALKGKALPISRFRGFTDFEGRRGFITVHPSYLLRLPADARYAAYQEFVSDLKLVYDAAYS